MENIDDFKDKTSLMILTQAAKKILQQKRDIDIVWINETVEELLDRFEEQLKEAECTDSDSE